ncbi:MucR family transcriptional regulator [Novosphingobium cyanobacteriorum]|uniref:MucR family transcriptional regulator n=1 Tax=Novosphingobium cyanobacteriorum TaxID=3024215 RepID=A0ABT6CIB6_9SPHN|nr:MucR family transcriptional regulator [Novosphingobium cyanobacteriorum]MDF8333669.1 MucR family transcriptional regulator [Novosphingobium cyanobacteriorum]
MSDANLFAHVADIVSAHVSNNAVAASDLPNLIKAVHASLTKLGEPAPAEQKRAPAVSIRSSVKPDGLTCLECGTKTQLLRRHLMREHKLLPDQYTTRWGLARDYPMVAPDYSERRKLLAVSIGLGLKSPRARAKERASLDTDGVDLPVISAGPSPLEPSSPGPGPQSGQSADT